jgi:hypothetical protein
VDAPVSGRGDSGAAGGAVGSAATVLADGTAGMFSVIAGADVGEPAAVETGATFATVDTGSAGGGGFGAIAGLGAGVLAATDVGGLKC